MQPPGDTATRRGIFDALAVGCIPVSLWREQLDAQYPLYLPADPYDAETGVAYLLPEEARARTLEHPNPSPSPSPSPKPNPNPSPTPKPNPDPDPNPNPGPNPNLLPE